MNGRLLAALMLACAVLVSVAHTARAQTGACCNPSNGTCSIVAQASCVSPNSFMTGATTCNPNPCPQPPQGTCCSPLGACIVTVQISCGGTNTWTLGQTCNPNPCPIPPQGTCCSPLGACIVSAQVSCSASNTWTQGQTCNPNPCPLPPQGTCCSPLGACVVSAQVSCSTSNTWTQGQTCSPNPCPIPPQGTCCAPSTGACVFGFQVNCAAPGVWTFGGTCTPNQCPQPAMGRCCNTATGACSVTTQANCSVGPWSTGATCDAPANPCPQPPMGTCCSPTSGACVNGPQATCTGSNVWTQGNTCEAVPCPTPGACCYADGSCTLVLPQFCPGEHRGPGSICPTANCSQPSGACCSTTGSCSILTRTACVAAAGTYRGNDVACFPHPCQQNLNVCCAGATCTLTLQSGCVGRFRVWISTATQCNSQANTTTPCCRPDFNKDGMVSSQDLFDFLESYFAGNPLADFVGNGTGIPSVNSVRAFVSAWSAGC